MRLGKTYSKILGILGKNQVSQGDEYVDLVAKQRLRVLSVGNNVQLGHVDGNDIVEKETSVPRHVLETAVRKGVVVPKDEFRR